MNYENIIRDKLHRLINSIRDYEKAAVAFSGGVDSTLLLYAAQKALGTTNVIALTLVSPVFPVHAITNCRAILKMAFFKGINHKEILAELLQWEGFIENNHKRCYLCKKKMYSLLIASLNNYPGYVLLDGTNADDTKEDRPGYRAVQELNVKTPLLNAGLQKTEIRKLARDVGFSNHNLPANSCLATRIPEGTSINEKLLKCIDRAESFLHKIGFSGCRVKPQGTCAIIEVQKVHMNEIIRSQNRARIKAYFLTLDFEIVALSFDQKQFS